MKPKTTTGQIHSKTNSHKRPQNRNSLKLGRLAVGITISLASFVQAQEVPAAKLGNSAENLGTVVVTARNRVETAIDVPIPVSVIDDVKLTSANLTTTNDFAKSIPNFTVITPNQRQNNLSIRGIGKNSSNEAYEPSVGIVIDNVYLEHPGSTWGSFTDLERVEVLRGPQGTLLGKSTTLGAINIVTKSPSFTPSSSFLVGVGNYSDVQFQASASGPLADKVLAYRASFSYEKADGPFRNTIANNTTDDKNRFAGKLQFLVLATSSLSARLIFDYSKSDERPAYTRPVTITDASTYADGVSRGATYSSRYARDYFQSIYAWQVPVNDWDHYTANDYQAVHSERKGGSAQINFSLGDWTVTSITARNTFVFEPHYDWDPYNIGLTGGSSASAQSSQEVRLSSPIGSPVDFQGGVYWLQNKNHTYNIPGQPTAGFGEDAGAWYATNPQYATLWANGGIAGAALLKASLNHVSTWVETHPVSTALAEYGQANWHITKKATLTVGVRYTDETRKNDNVVSLLNGGADLDALGAAYGLASTDARIVAAKAIRSNNAKLYNFTTAEKQHGSIAWLINPSYKVSDIVSFYASASEGEKSGVVTFFSGVPLYTKPENARDYELGLKSLLLNKQLFFNLNLYNTDVTDYQTNIRTLDPTKNDGSYTSISGNVPKVRSRGVEIDGAYSLTESLSLTFAGAYNDAIYADFKNGPLAPEINPASANYVDYTGRRLSGASKITASLGVEFKTLVGPAHLLHVSSSDTYRSRFNGSFTLSQYGWQEAFHLFDAGIGVGTKDGKYDISLIGKNILDKKYITLAQDGSTTGILEAAGGIGSRRSIILVLRANF